MISKFIDYIRIERHYSERTVGEYERDLHEFCSFLQVEPDAFDATMATAADVRMWVVGMMDAGMSPRSVRRKLSALRSYYKFLLRIGLIKQDITRSVVAPKTDKPLPVFFKEAEMQKAVCEMKAADDFESLRNNLIIEMLYETGMRRAELLGLTDGDVDLNQMQVRVFGKRRKERIVPFGENLKTMLVGYIEGRNEALGLISAPDQPLLTNHKGGKLPISTLYNIVRTRMGEVSSLKKHSPHVLRHTFATQMLGSGADINSIKALMGHASLAATQIYTHTTFDQLRDAYLHAHPRATRKNKE